MLKTSLRYFLAVARHGSIRAACAELNVAQSAVSRQVQALEREVGAALFRRGRGGMALTPDGTLLLAFGQTAADDFEALVTEVRQIGTLERGHVEVACIEEMVASVLPGVLRAFKARHPAITFGISILKTDQVVAKLRAGEAHWGIAFPAAVGPEFQVAFRSEEPLLAVTAPGHPLAGRGRVSLRDVARWPLALPPPDNPVRCLFDHACDMSGIEPRPAFETNSPELLRRYVEAGDGITVLIRHAVDASLARGAVAAFQLEDWGMSVPLEVLVLRTRVLPPASQAMLEMLIRGIQTGN